MNKMQKQTKINRKKTMTKKALEEFNKSQRVMVSMNTGTRTHSSKKDYNRQSNKQALRKMLAG